MAGSATYYGLSLRAKRGSLPLQNCPQFHRRRIYQAPALQQPHRYLYPRLPERHVEGHHHGKAEHGPDGGHIGDAL
jgi:hypothetical protein